MQLIEINQTFSICKIADCSEIDFSDPFCFVGKTDEELSLVCGSQFVPKHPIEHSPGWRAFRVEGILDFSLTGILAKLSAVLADANIGIFAVSTYNTDYILTKEEHFDAALAALAAVGYQIKRCNE